ncbi:glycosyltransferase family 61 protein [Pseudanabaenaceae cyanobacterium LEGE 13415]|nr:glycosyltransferase family 61 protein [Pseudanabaenaceae cyanobacterium LEGE 13415]
MSIVPKITSRVLSFLYQHWRNQPPMCESVKDWSKTQSPTIAELLYEQRLSSQSVDVPMPTVVGETTHDRLWEKFSRRSRYTLSERYLVSIAEAKLVGEIGAVILPDGAYTIETAWRKEQLMRLPEYYSVLKKWRLKPVKKAGNYFSLLQLYCNGNNYYHWMHDVLSKLFVVIDLLPEDVTYIVPPQLKDWQYEALEMVGIRREQTLVFEPKEQWQLEKLYFAPLVSSNAGHSLSAIEWLRDSAYQRFGIDSQESRTERIFISRSRAVGRTIVNQDEVEALLDRYGFKSYCLEEMSIEQQVSLFSKAEIVIAPHGAGLTNLMFAPSGTKVLEIFEPSAGGVCFWSLCHCLNHPYQCLFGKTVPNPKFAAQPNILVSIETLASALPAFVGEPIPTVSS